MGQDKFFRNAVLMQVVLTIIGSYCFAMLAFVLKQRGLSVTDFGWFFVLYFVTPLVLILLNHRISFHACMILSCLIYSILLLMMALELPLWYYSVFSVINGFLIFYFWVPFNSHWYGLASEGNRAFTAGIQFAIGPVLNVFLPALAGLSFTYFGIKYALLGILFVVILWFLANRSPEIVVQYSLAQVLRESKGVRTLLFLEGFWEIIPFAAIPVLSLLYFDTAIELGLFGSLVGLSSAIAALFLSKLSDDKKERLSFIIPVTVLLGISSALPFFFRSTLGWIVSVAVFNFVSVPAWTFMTTLVLDKVHDVPHAMVARELFLNLGRLVGAFAFLWLGIIGNVWLIFLLIGCIYLLYPVLVYWKRIYH